MQGIKDDMFCATLTITLIVGCLMQLNTSMTKSGKRFFQTTPFNCFKQNFQISGLFLAKKLVPTKPIIYANKYIYQKYFFISLHISFKFPSPHIEADICPVLEFQNLPITMSVTVTVQM